MRATTHFAEPKKIADPQQCYFYHTTELPGHGIFEGEWDLRENIDAYLGHTDFAGKRVLEVGTASGFVCFAMEKRGADVIAFDLSEQDDWDIIPYHKKDLEKYRQDRRWHARHTNNAWWLAHDALQSNAKMVYGNVYDLPQDLGPVDITTFGCVLLHLRDPFLALQKAAALTTETIIVTEAMPTSLRSTATWWKRLLLLNAPLTFLPNPLTRSPQETWWQFSPAIIKRFLKILGFTKTRVTYHTQKYKGRDVQMFTVVGSSPG